jgi:hypothetical protein
LLPYYPDRVRASIDYREEDVMETIVLVGGPLHGEYRAWNGGDCFYAQELPLPSITLRDPGPPSPEKIKIATIEYRRSDENPHEFVFRPQ